MSPLFPAVELWNPNHWITKKLLNFSSLFALSYFYFEKRKLDFLEHSMEKNTYTLFGGTYLTNTLEIYFTDYMLLSSRFFICQRKRCTLCVCMLSHPVMSNSETPWTAAHQTPLSMGFSRQEYWSGLPLPTPGDLPNPGIKPMTLASPELAGGFFTTVPPVKPLSVKELH